MSVKISDKVPAVGMSTSKVAIFPPCTIVTVFEIPLTVLLIVTVPTRSNKPSFLATFSETTDSIRDLVAGKHSIQTTPSATDTSYFTLLLSATSTTPPSYETSYRSAPTIIASFCNCAILMLSCMPAA